MGRAMRVARTILLSVGACVALSVLAVWLVRNVIPFDADGYAKRLGEDIADYGEPPWVVLGMSRFHQGDGPCLRYARSSYDEGRSAIDDALLLGITREALKKADGPLEARGLASEQMHHPLSSSEEWLEALSTRRGFRARVVLWLERERLRAAMARLLEPVQRPRAPEGDLEPAMRRLYERHPLEFAAHGVWRVTKGIELAEAFRVCPSWPPQ